MENIVRSLSRFWFPALSIIAGLALLISAMDAEAPQPSEVKLGAACILIVGVISLLFLLDVIKKPVRLAILFVCLIAAGYLFVKSKDSITTEISAKKEAKFIKDQTVQGLKDVRSALEAYRLSHGGYTQNLDELMDFVENGTVPKMMKIGQIPDSVASEEQAMELGLIVKMPSGMTAEQVKEQGLIVRDTVQITVMEDKFDSEFAKKLRLFPFDLKNIKFSPASKKPWEIQAGYANMGGVQQPVVEVKESEPYKGGKALQIGSLKDAHLNGNWDDE